jgi:hypothetical protein
MSRYQDWTSSHRGGKLNSTGNFCDVGCNCRSCVREHAFLGCTCCGQQLAAGSSASGSQACIHQTHCTTPCRQLQKGQPHTTRGWSGVVELPALWCGECRCRLNSTKGPANTTTKKCRCMSAAAPTWALEGTAPGSGLPAGLLLGLLLVVPSRCVTLAGAALTAGWCGTGRGDGCCCCCCGCCLCGCCCRTSGAAALAAAAAGCCG